MILVITDNGGPPLCFIMRVIRIMVRNRESGPTLKEERSLSKGSLTIKNETVPSSDHIPYFRFNDQ